MSDKSSTNYPDLLGHITGGERANIGPVQAALALRPRIARAGRPVGVNILLQNTTDSDLEVSVRLRLPERDANKQKGRFITKAEKLVVDVRPAEVGRILLPVSTMPDTAADQGYKIGVEIKLKPKQRGKPNRVRLPEGGAHVNVQFMDEDRQEEIEELSDLHWFTQARGSSLEANLSVMSGKVGKFTNLEPSYQSLWTLADHTDDRALFTRYADVIRDEILPRLSREKVFSILLAQTKKTFSQGDYAASPIEISLITRLLTLVVELAAAEERDVRLVVGKELNIQQYLSKNYLNNPENDIVLPQWFAALLRIISRDERMIQFPMRAVAHFAYADLLHDAILHAYERIEGVTGKPLVKASERGSETQNVLAAVNNQAMNFKTLYAPLVIGGILVADQVLLPVEQGNQLAAPMREMLDKRHAERNEQTEALFKLANQLIEQLFNKYSMSKW